MQKEVVKRKVVTYCDFCERKIKHVEYRCDTCGTADKMLPIYRTRVWNTNELFPHLCENCARKLDRTLQFMQDGLTKRGEIMQRNVELNRIRRELLGSKG